MEPGSHRQVQHHVHPEALLDEVAPKWRDAIAAIESVDDTEGEARNEALAALAKKWTVVREPSSAKPE